MLYQGIKFEIDFNIGSLLIFLAGIGFGLLLFGLLYLYFTLRTLKDKKYYVDSKLEYVVKENEIKNIIKYHQDKYLIQRKDENKDIAGRAMKDALSNVVLDIATKYFPDSKRPLLELSIDELIMLMRYITDRVDKLLGHRGIRILRKVKLSTIMNIVDKSIKVNNTQAVQVAKKYKVGKIVKTGGMILNALNPFYWIKKGTTKLVTATLYKKITLIIISIAGEETYKIYSKQAFKEQDPSYIKMMNDIELILEESDSIDELKQDELNSFVDNLPNDEQQLLLTMRHDKNKKWWKMKAKEKVNNK